MNKKILVIVLMLSLTVMLIPSGAHAAGIPNINTLTYATIGGPDSSCGTDTGGAYDTSSATLIQQVYEPLFMYNKTDVNSFIPLLADSWPGYNWTGYSKAGNWLIPLHPDNATEMAVLTSLGITPPTLHIHYLGDVPTEEVWVFHIRHGVKWQNSSYGTVKPSDFAYTIQRNLLQDFPITGVQWLMYVPLSGGMCSNSRGAAWQSKAYTAAHGISPGNFSANLLPFVRGAIQCNDEYVWFNLPGAFPAFMQILTQSWGMCMSKDWLIKQKCWNVGAYDNVNLHFTGDDNFAAFNSTWHPPTSPLVASSVISSAEPMMGSGPYKLTYFNPDPHTGVQAFTRFDNYWRGLAPTQFATIKIVEEWSNRKAQFLSTAESLQCDLTDVPRANCPELHVGLDKDADPLPGLSLTKLYQQTADYLYFTYTVQDASLYKPKLGDTVKPDLFTDRNLRLGFMYSFNATQFLHDYFMNEAVTPPSFICNGTRFFNASTAFVRNIDLVKAQNYFRAAWGGQVWANGMTVALVYNTGNIARYTIASMMADVITNRINWSDFGGCGKANIHVVPTAEAWSDFTVDLAGNLPIFAVGWIADYPDPSDWSGPFLDPGNGVYATWQNITYGLDNSSMEWLTYPTHANYPNPYVTPFKDPFGYWVTQINTTYVSTLVMEAATTADDAKAEASYEEMMDFWYAEAPTLPTDQGVGRHYERDWVQGWIGGYSNNPVAVGDYFYEMYKAVPLGYSVVGVNLDAIHSITNTSTVYRLMQVINGTEGPLELVWKGSEAFIDFHVHVRYVNVTGPIIYANIELRRLNVWTGEYYFTTVATVSLENNTAYSFDIPWNETSTATNGTWAISFRADPLGSAGKVVYPSNATSLEVNCTYSDSGPILAMIGPSLLGDLGCPQAAIPYYQFGNFSGDVQSADTTMFIKLLRAYRGQTTAPRQFMYLGDLGSPKEAIPYYTVYVYDVVIDSADVTIYTRALRGLSVYTGP